MSALESDGSLNGMERSSFFYDTTGLATPTSAGCDSDHRSKKELPVFALGRKVVGSPWKTLLPNRDPATESTSAPAATLPPTLTSPSTNGTATAIEGRFGHTAFVHRDNMYVFGGRGPRAVSNELWRLSLSSLTSPRDDASFVQGSTGDSSSSHPPGAQWVLVHEGTAPLPATTAAPTATIASTGEESSGSGNSIPNTTTVSAPPLTNPTPWRPLPRAGHTSTTADGTMYLFGGGDGETLMGDLWALDLDTLLWSQKKPKPFWDEQVQQYCLPHPRKGHTAVFIDQLREIWVFGGMLSTRLLRQDNSIWAYSVDKNCWRVVSMPEQEGDASCRPASRMYHTAEYDPVGQKMYIFGGRLIQPNHRQPFLDELYVFDLQESEWSKIGPSPSQQRNWPAPRMCPGSVFLHGRLCIFNGGNASYLSDSHEFDPKKKTWSPMPSSTVAPRTRPTLVVYQNNLVLFGGCCRDIYYNDVLVLSLRVPPLQVLCQEWIETALCYFPQVSSTVPSTSSQQPSPLALPAAISPVGGEEEEGPPAPGGNVTKVPARPASVLFSAGNRPEPQRSNPTAGSPPHSASALAGHPVGLLPPSVIQAPQQYPYRPYVYQQQQQYHGQQGTGITAPNPQQQCGFYYHQPPPTAVSQPGLPSPPPGFRSTEYISVVLHQRHQQPQQQQQQQQAYAPRAGYFSSKAAATVVSAVGGGVATQTSPSPQHVSPSGPHQRPTRGDSGGIPFDIPLLVRQRISSSSVDKPR